MTKTKPIISAISIALASTIMSVSAMAATPESLPDMAVLAALSIDENRSTTFDGETKSNKAPATPTAPSRTSPMPPDRMGQLIDRKKETAAADTQNPDNTVAADNMSAAELTRKDEQSDSTDDISAGQAVAAPSDVDSIDSSDPLAFELPEQELRQDFSDDPTIKNIEDKDGKRYTTLNLSNYAKQVNDAKWSPNMNVNSAMTIKLQALLDWNHASPGPIDGGWGMNSKKALINFQNMKGLPATGKMDQKTWDALIKNIPANKPVLVTYTLTDKDIKTNFATTPSGSEAKSKMKGLYYQDIKEMLAERFHMDVRYLDKLNKNKAYKAGETITVLNTRAPLGQRITRVVANKADKTLYAYNGDKLVATYPTTVGSDATPSPQGTFKIVNKVKMPWYKATVGSGDSKKVHMLPPGPNNPVGVVWMGLSKPSYGLHGSPKPEGISRQASAGCVRLTNWDVLEVYANIENGATVELK